MIQLHNLTAGYTRPILQNVTLSFPRGRFTVLLGPNGSGKSTLLRSLLGLCPVRSGDILVDGVPAATMSPRTLAQWVSYLPQLHRVPEMTVYQLALQGRYPHHAPNQRYTSADHILVRQVLAQLELTELANVPLSQLSGGQSQRAYLAMALVQDTPAILLDEPSAFLDIAHQLELMALCKSLASQGKAVVLVLHDLALALEYADEIALLDKGRLAFHGTPEALLATQLLEQVFSVRILSHPAPEGTTYAVRLCH